MITLFLIQAKNLTGSEAERTSTVKVTAEDGTLKEYKVVFSVKPEQKPADNNSVDNTKKNENETSQSTNSDKDKKVKFEISNKEESPYTKKVVGSILGVLGVGALAGIVIFKKLKR